MIGRVRPPKEARRLARSALRTRADLPKSEKFSTPAGLYAGKRISTGETVDGDAVYRFLTRWEAAYQRELRAGRKSPRSSKIVGAYYLWGGPPMLAYLRRKMRLAKNKG